MHEENAFQSLPRDAAANVMTNDPLCYHQAKRNPTPDFRIP